MRLGYAYWAAIAFHSNRHFHLTSSPALLHWDIRLFRAKTLQPIGCSPTIFCTVSWEVLKLSQSIRCLVPSAAAPIRGWMAWQLVIEYFQISEANLGMHFDTAGCLHFGGPLLLV